MKESKEKLVSIIVPVYNVEKCLLDTLNCLSQQSYGDIEIVLIDDGSTDKSPAICKKFAAEDSRFKYVRQENAGAGAARNKGIDIADGEFLLFADADDLYERDLVAKLYDAILCDRADVAICRADTFIGSYGDAPARPYSVYQQGGSCTPGDMANRFFQSVTCVPWDKLFRADYIKSKGFRFQTLKYSNDNYFVLMSLLHSTRISWIEEVLVHHRVGAGDSLRDRMFLAPTCDLDMLDSLRAAFYSSSLKNVPGLAESLDSYTASLVSHSYAILATQEAKACEDFWHRLVFKSLPEWERTKGGPLEIGSLKQRLKFNVVKFYRPERIIWAYSILGKNGMRTAAPSRKRLAFLRFLISPLIVHD